MSRFHTLIVIAAVFLLLGLAALPVVLRRNTSVSAQNAEAPAQPTVQVALAAHQTMTRTLRLSGALKSGSQASLSPKAGGRVVSVYVREGDTVKRGQPLVKLDTSDVQRQVEQAAAGVAAARAAWQKAIEGERLKRVSIQQRIAEAGRGVEQARTQLEKAEAGIRLQRSASGASIQQAQAGVDAAQAALERARKGARPEQRRQAEIQLRSAERAVELAKRSLDDVQFVYDKGGLPRVQLDQARENYQKALDGRAQAQNQLDLLAAGAAPEEIAAAEAQVRSAESGLAAARAAANRQEVDDADLKAARTQLARAQDGLQAAQASRQELDLAASDIRAARAAYDQALAASRLASQQLQGGVISSPLDGLVTTVSTNPGEIAGPGRPLIQITGTAGVYLEAAAPARLLTSVRPGQACEVTVDALPGRTFPGTVREISTVAGPDGRSFPVKIDLSAPAGVLRPGALARAEVEAQSYADAVTVPTEALRPDGDRTTVWLVREGRVTAVPVETPIQSGARAVVRGDVRAGDQVVLSGPPGLSPGDSVQTSLASPS